MKLLLIILLTSLLSSCTIYWDSDKGLGIEIFEEPTPTPTPDIFERMWYGKKVKEKVK